MVSATLTLGPCLRGWFGGPWFPQMRVTMETYLLGVSGFECHNICCGVLFARQPTGSWALWKGAICCFSSFDSPCFTKPACGDNPPEPATSVIRTSIASCKVVDAHFAYFP